MSEPIKLVSVNFDHNGKWTSVFAQGSAVELSEFLAKNGDRLNLKPAPEPKQEPVAQPLQRTTQELATLKRKAWLWDQLWLAAERDDIKVEIQGEVEALGWVLIAGSAQDAEELLESLAREKKP